MFVLQNLPEKWILQIYETRIKFLYCIPLLVASAHCKQNAFVNVCLSWCLTQDPFGEKRGRFDYQGLLARLGATHRRIREKLLAEDERNEDESDSETSSSGTDPDSQGSSHP